MKKHTETDRQRLIQLEVSSPLVRLWRNNVGEAWQGSNFSIINGQLHHGHARRVVYGLCPGSSDLIGLRSVIVTPEMVGRQVAIFTAIEVKEDKRNPTEPQKNFIGVIRGLGGLAGVARSVEDANKILDLVLTSSEHSL